MGESLSMDVRGAALGAAGVFMEVSPSAAVRGDAFTLATVAAVMGLPFLSRGHGG